jgi:Uma2 family endonuclease
MNVPLPPVLPPEDWPNVDHLVTEDDTPVDNLFSEKQRRLLVEPLYSSWEGPGGGRPFLALSDVGLFFALNRPPLVPDALLSIDVQAPANPWPKHHRSYFVWMYGKVPDVVIEVVSNREGGEADEKLRAYAAIGVPYYVIFDPLDQLSGGVLRLFELRRRSYEPISVAWFPEVGLGLTLWQGRYEEMEATWLRWCDQQGRVVPTGAERAEQERQRAEQERQQVEQERQRAEQERQRAERLAAQLRALGIAPQA